MLDWFFTSIKLWIEESFLSPKQTKFWLSSQVSPGVFAVTALCCVCWMCWRCISCDLFFTFTEGTAPPRPTARQPTPLQPTLLQPTPGQKGRLKHQQSLTAHTHTHATKGAHTPHTDCVSTKIIVPGVVQWASGQFDLSVLMVLLLANVLLVIPLK